MRRIMLSFLCLLMHLLQVETTSLLVLENQDLQDSIKPQKWPTLPTTLPQDALHGKLEATLGAGPQGLLPSLAHWYGQSTWQNKDNCWGIPSRVCDLTHETSDIQEPYYGRVRATLAGVYSSWSLSCRFTPWRETMVGPPMVTVVHSNNSIIVKLQAPQSPYKRKRGSKITMTNYYDLLYQVFIINNLLDEQHRVLVYEGKDKVIKIQDLRPGVSYCIVAKTYVPMLDRSSAYSSRQCTVLQ
ncbi:interleukin-22 receptor subunit alpha-2 isoform X1 [Corvus hawaiiensis]|uniref:interleukin-22 receptor subunit alpha-2 isoform X1 n=1 Tax=Corvus hawaiiensis TaxID=134902 RepID=UPI002019EFDE|nr:interleukin-22 receptor subunit alpha-2 isoform X1 [Corvus hawaiiensis]